MQSAPRQLELPAAARKSELCLSRFPLRGKHGAGGLPQRRWHAARQQNASACNGAAAPPERGVSKRSAETPVEHPPEMEATGAASGWSVDLRDRAGEKITDRRHVGVDFYDLRIETYYKARGSPPKKEISSVSASLKDSLIALCSGATLLLPSPATRENMNSLCRWVDESKVLAFANLPSLFRLMIRSLAGRRQVVVSNIDDSFSGWRSPVHEGCLGM